jgi:hypothetical protein
MDDRERARAVIIDGKRDLTQDEAEALDYVFERHEDPSGWSVRLDRRRRIFVEHDDLSSCLAVATVDARERLGS